MVIVSQNSINLFIFIREKWYVFWKFGTEVFNILFINFIFWGEGGLAYLSWWEKSFSNTI
jgi:hypothetical protein